MTAQEQQPAPQATRDQVAEQAQRVVVLFDLARRGLLPLNKLEAVVDRRILDGMGPLPPPPTGAPLRPARIGGVRVQMTGDRHAHVAAVAHTDGHEAAGYILELHRDGAVRPWRVTQLSRVEHRHLVGPDPEDGDDIADRRTRRLPDNLAGLIRATQHAREQAAAQLHRVEQQQGAIRAKPRNTTRQRTEVTRQAAQARRDVNQWRSRLTDIDEELQELRDAAALREMRAAVLAGDPVVAPRRNQLEMLLGPIPDRQDQRAGWRQTARQLLDYAAAWNVDDLLRDLPEAASTRDIKRGQSEDRQTMRALVDSYRHDRGWAALQRASADELHPGDRVLMQHGTCNVLTYRGVEPESGQHVLEDDDGHVYHRSNRQGQATFWRADQSVQLASENAGPPLQIEL